MTPTTPDPKPAPATDEEINSLNVSPGAWEAARLWDETTNTPLSGEAAKTYVAGCIDLGGQDFFAVLVQKQDGPADICHTGNGPTSWENARAIAMLPCLLARISSDRAENAKLRARVAELEEMYGELQDWVGEQMTPPDVVEDALVQIVAKAEHFIPPYAYGDNEAACEFANLLEQIHSIAHAALKPEPASR